MPTYRLNAQPTVQTVSLRASEFALLTGAKVNVRFFGVGDSWEEEAELIPGDSLSFDSEFERFDITATYQTQIEVYAGRAVFRRNQTEVVASGADSIVTRGMAVPKAETLIAPPNRSRRSITVLPLSGTVYVGALGTAINDKIPVAAGQSVTLHVVSALYAETPASHNADTTEIRMIEEVN